MLIAVPFYGYLARSAGFDRIVQNLLIFPATTFREVRHLPYPALAPDWSIWSNGGSFDSRLDRLLGDYLRFYLPLLVFGLSTLLVFRSAARAGRNGDRFVRTDSMAAGLVVMGCGLFMQATSRYDAIHVLPASLVVIILIAWLVKQIPAERWRQPLVAVLVGTLLIVPVVLYFLLPYGKLSGQVREHPPMGCYSDLPRAGCVATLAGQDDVIHLLDQEDPQRTALYSGLPRHDNVFANDASIYFLAGRPIATRYHELHPGVATTQPVQEEMVNELSAQDVEWLVFIKWGNPNEPNASAVSSGVTLLDDYIRNQYRREVDSGLYELWRRLP